MKYVHLDSELSTYKHIYVRIYYHRHIVQVYVGAHGRVNGRVNGIVNDRVNGRMLDQLGTVRAKCRCSNMYEKVS